MIATRPCTKKIKRKNDGSFFSSSLRKNFIVSDEHDSFEADEKIFFGVCMELALKKVPSKFDGAFSFFLTNNECLFKMYVADSVWTAPREADGRNGGRRFFASDEPCFWISNRLFF